jgi:tyrosine aminotransferase
LLSIFRLKQGQLIKDNLFSVEEDTFSHFYVTFYLASNIFYAFNITMELTEYTRDKKCTGNTVALLSFEGIETREYNLLPDQNWEVDLGHMESLIDDKTVAIIVNNPSNPCGSVFSIDHLKKILDIAERNKVPIIADEIYDNFVFPGQVSACLLLKLDKKANTFSSQFASLFQIYVPVASLTASVPVLSCGGLTKRYLVPGWRLGWIVIYDRKSIFENGQIRSCLKSVSQRLFGPNTVVAGALPAILANTPASFFTETISAVQKNAVMAYSMLSAAPGLLPIMPQVVIYDFIGSNSI